MTYQVLARKWRPQQFSEMIGQEHVLRALVNALDTQRLHHAYLFTGMRGVGKTTIARVFAKSLNCETNGVSSSPCGECSTCRDIEAGSYIDLIEVDAASKTGVDDTRELLENVPYAPASGRYKVYLIDEVHMFSKSAFNALLKTLEEPPEHVKFLLATTDPEKVLVTILSRCLQFNLKSVPASVLCDYLGKLLDQEGISWEQTALGHIAEASEGSVRDSLSLVEQAAAFGQGSVTASDVESMLGRLSPSRVIDLLEAVATNDAASVLSQINTLSEYGPDYTQLLGSILSVLHQVALIQAVPDSVGDAVLNRERLQQLAGQISGEDAQLYYQIGLLGRRDMPYAPDQRAALEMILLRMVSFLPITSPNTGTSTGSSTSEGSSSREPGSGSGSGSVESPDSPSKSRPVSSESGKGTTQAIRPDQPPSASADQSVPQALDQIQSPLQASGVQPSGVQPSGNEAVAVERRASAVGGNAVGHAGPTGNTSTNIGATSTSAEANATRKAMLEAALAVTPESKQSRSSQTTQPNPATQIAPVPESNQSLVTDEKQVSDAVPEGSEVNDAQKGQTEDRTDDLVGESDPARSGVAESGIAESIRDDHRDQNVETDGGKNQQKQQPPQDESLLADGPWHAGNWLQIVGQLKLEGMPGQLLDQCAFVSLDDNVLSLQIENEFEHLKSEPFIEKVQDRISRCRQVDTTVTIRLLGEPVDSPARMKAKNQELAMEAARLSIAQDPLVKELLDKVDGVVDAKSVRPVQ